MPKKLTTEEFISRSNKVHNNKYDYSKVVYLGNSVDVIIICPEHGEFKQRPIHHLNKSGCPICGGTKRLTTEEFIKRSDLIHNNKYDYSESVYINNVTKIKIICPEHGEFKQWPKDHYTGIGCPKCYGSETRNEKIKKGLDLFVSDANKVHNNKYDYSKFVYINNKTKGIIICRLHGDFEQTPNNHLRGTNCPKCSLESAKEKLVIWHSENKINNLTQEEFVQKIKEINEDSITVIGNYVNSLTKVEMSCLIHGSFFATPNNLLYNKSGCLICSQSLITSKSEYEIINLIKSFYSGEIIQSYRPDFLNGKELDIYIPEFNFAIEFNGGYWHSDKFKDPWCHFDKWKMCHDNRIKLLTIWDFYWADLNKMNIYLSKIKHFLRMDTVIYGRRCFIKEIEKDLAISFIKENHLEGMGIPYSKSSYIGLYEANELLMVCIYGEMYSQSQKGFKWKIQRIATKQGYTVIGGVSKLVKYIKLKIPEIQFQITLDTGGTLMTKKEITRKDISLRYWWVKNYFYLTRNSTQVSILKKNFDWLETDSEKSYMERNGYFQVWDSGILNI